jgi:hypothetical protein
MLDQIYSLRNKNRFVLTTNNYRPEDALISRKLDNCFSDKLAVLFAPWHGAEWLYDRLTSRLEKHGWSVLTYQFSPEILKPDVDQVIASFTYLQTSIATDLQELLLQNKYSKIHLIGTSLGNLPLALASEKFTNFDQVTMVAASSNLAQATWEGLRTQDIRNEFMKNGMTESALNIAWDGIAPKHHVSGLRHNRVNLIISKTDRVIPTKFQLEYLTAVREAGAKVRESYTHLGHYGSIIDFCLNGQLDY